MTRHNAELYAVTASTQNVLNVVHQTLSRVLMVGIAGFRRCLHLQCLPVPRELPRQTVSTKRPSCVTGIRRTLESGVDGLHTPHTWKT